MLNVLLKTTLKFDSVMKQLSAGSNTSDRIWDLPILLFEQKSLQKCMIRMFVLSIKNERILILIVKLTIAEGGSIAKFSAAITFIFVNDDIVDICSPVKHFQECCQKSHQILKKSQV